MQPKYVVIYEHTLGYVIPHETPAFRKVGILHTSVLRGSHYDPYAGWVAYPMDESKVRPATLEDFEAYRVAVPSDFADEQVQIEEALNGRR